jgi:cell wall-associated NlpC family hydrolase
MIWKDMLAIASTEQTLQRAHSTLSKGTKYVLGKGGIDPIRPLTSQCDCSGFVAWAIGIPRQLPPVTGEWLSTDQYWAGGKPVKAGLFSQIKLADAVAGDLLVYPDSGGHQGHISIINQADNGLPSFIIHCSLGNWNTYGDAIRITSPSVFLSANHPTKAMRINYEMLKQFL